MGKLESPGIEDNASVFDNGESAREERPEKLDMSLLDRPQRREKRVQTEEERVRDEMKIEQAREVIVEIPAEPDITDRLKRSLDSLVGELEGSDLYKRCLELSEFMIAQLEILNSQMEKLTNQIMGTVDKETVKQINDRGGAEMVFATAVKNLNNSLRFLPLVRMIPSLSKKVEVEIDRVLNPENLAKVAESAAYLRRNNIMIVESQVITDFVFRLAKMEHNPEVLESLVLADKNVEALLLKKYLKTSEEKRRQSPLPKLFNQLYGSDFEQKLSRFFGMTSEKNTDYQSAAAYLHLEKEEPGLAQFIYEKFKIKNFGNYTIGTLRYLRESYGRNDRPQGVLLMCSFDHNGAFHSFDVPMEELIHDLDAMGYDLRIFEVENKYSVARSLVGSKKRYDRKFSFLVLAGHGRPGAIAFGPGRPWWQRRNGDQLRSSDLKSSSLDHVREEYFEDNPVGAFISCSTGKKGGIAQKLSGRLSGEITGPDRPVPGGEIKPVMENGRLAFKIDYGLLHHRKYTYRQGKMMGE